jgi:hypothetical protein
VRCAKRGDNETTVAKRRNARYPAITAICRCHLRHFEMQDAANPNLNCHDYHADEHDRPEPARRVLKS